MREVFELATVDGGNGHGGAYGTIFETMFETMSSTSKHLRLGMGSVGMSATFDWRSAIQYIHSD